MKKSIFLISLTGLVASFTPAHAENAPINVIKAQRNCGPDVIITSNTNTASTECTWKANEHSNMQVTLRVAKDVHFIAAWCTFTPASASADKVKDVKTSKSGTETGSATPKSIPTGYQMINNNDVKAIIRNFNTNFDDDGQPPSHVNLLFYLNNEHFTAGNHIACKFVPILPSTSI